jgi:hypothetical protein
MNLVKSKQCAFFEKVKIQILDEYFCFCIVIEMRQNDMYLIDYCQNVLHGIHLHNGFCIGMGFEMNVDESDKL